MFKLFKVFFLFCKIFSVFSSSECKDKKNLIPFTYLSFSSKTFLASSNSFSRTTYFVLGSRLLRASYFETNSVCFSFIFSKYVLIFSPKLVGINSSTSKISFRLEMLLLRSTVMDLISFNNS